MWNEYRIDGILTSFFEHLLILKRDFIQSLYDRVERARCPETDLRRPDSFIEIIRDLCRLNEHDERHAPGEAGS